MIENWKIVAGTEARYEVSDLGRVRRADGLLLKASKPRNQREYPAVMMRHHGTRKRVAVHRLVALAFVGVPPFAGAEVRHRDGDHLNAKWDNLEWGSAKDNAADRDAHGRTARGPRPNRRGKAIGAANGNYSVTPEIAARACDLVDQGKSQREAGSLLGIHQASVYRALKARALSSQEREVS